MSQTAVAPVTVSGGSSGAGNATVPIRLISLSQNLNNSEYGAVQGPEPNGHLTILGVTPGAYHVAVGSGSECVDSITSGSADLSHTDYVITAGSPPPPINIALRSDCASLEISLPAQQSNQPAAIPAAIVVVGGPSAAEPEVTYSSGSSPQTVKLSPGEYQVYAFSNLQNIEYANPDVLKNYASQHVSLSPNQRATIRVELNAPGGSR